MVQIFKDKLSIEIETKYPIDEYLQLLELSYEQMKQLTK